MRSKGLLASVGVATATVTTFAGFAPAVVTTAGAVDGSDDANVATADPAADGTYESCSAYFGYGKNDETETLALDLTTFPVTVEGGTPAGEAPTVENGAIDVVLVLTDVDGAELRCVPEEVTEAEWDATWGPTPIPVNIPAWPGPGHYAYPSILPSGLGVGSNAREFAPLLARPAAIGDLNDLASVGFEVTSVPEGYTLVDPLATQGLPQTFSGFVSGVITDPASSPVIPRALQVIVSGAGPAAAQAYAVALGACVADNGQDPPNADDPNLVAAVQALADYLIKPDQVPVVEAPVSCGEIGSLLFASVLVFGVEATIDTASPITVSLPLPPPPPAAEPAEVTPAFTG